MNRTWLAVLRKELVDGLRDRRSLAAALLFSLFGPLVLAAALMALAEQKDVKNLEIAVADAAGASELISFLGTNDIAAQPAPADLEGALRRRDFDLALRIDPHFALDVESLRPGRVELLYDSSRRASRERARRVEEVLQRFDQRTARSRLLARGIAPSSLSVLEVERRDFATPAAKAGVALGMLPIFLLMAAFMAGMSLAIDATAGERERGSLEGLLIHPVSRHALVWGKWLASALLAAVGVALTLFASARMLTWEKVQSLDLSLGMECSDIATLLAVLLPVALLAPALQVAIALVSHNFKEAQTYLSFVFMVPTLPGFYFSFTNREPAPWMDWVPLLGHQVTMMRALSGEGVSVATLFGLGGGTIALALALTSLAGWLLGRERIVFGR